jgi:hypothetical protein
MEATMIQTPIAGALESGVRCLRGSRIESTRSRNSVRRVMPIAAASTSGPH